VYMRIGHQPIGHQPYYNIVIGYPTPGKGVFSLDNGNKHNVYIRCENIHSTMGTHDAIATILVRRCYDGS